MDQGGDLMTLLSNNPISESGGQNVDYSDGLPDDEPIELDAEDEKRETYEGEKYGEPEGEKLGGEVIKKEATVFVNMLDNMQCRGFSFYSGEGRDNYKMDSQEKEELIEATAAWMEATQVALSPSMAFFMTVISIIGYNATKAYQDKILKEESRKAKKAFEKKAEGSPVTEHEEKVMENVKEKLQRAQFKCDKDGFYMVSEGGTYLKDKTKREKAPTFIFSLVKEMKKEGKSEKEINLACRKRLQGEGGVGDV
jgi:hypothetical protein